MLDTIQTSDTIQVSRTELFNLYCNLEFSLADFRARATAASHYGDKSSYITARRDFNDTIRLLETPLFNDWHYLRSKDLREDFPAWHEPVIRFIDGSTIDDTVDVPF